MKHSLDTHEFDALRYDTDGRRYHVQIEGDVLRVNVAAYMTNNGKFKAVLVLIVVAAAIFLALSSVFGIVPQNDPVTPILILWAVVFPWLLIVAKFPTRFAARWDFDRAHNKLQINAADFAPLSDIAGIVGIKKGKNRFLLALDFKDGKRKFIGDYFSTKEFSWREDAQKIASFLNVPLLIPDVYEV